MICDDDNLFTRAYEDYHAGRIELKDFYAAVDRSFEHDREVEEEEQRRREQKRKGGWKPFISVGINFKL